VVRTISEQSANSALAGKSGQQCKNMAVCIRNLRLSTLSTGAALEKKKDQKKQRYRKSE